MSRRKRAFVHLMAVAALWLVLPAVARAGPPAVREDWALQDGLYAGGTLRTDAVQKCIGELGQGGKALRERYDVLARDRVPDHDPRWLELYHAACEKRRARRLGPYLEGIRRIVFTKHFNMGGSHYAYTEAQSDAQAERNFVPGSALCNLEMDGLDGRVRTLIEDPRGVIRDPDVSWDGRRILFSWKKSDRGDDYHLYEMSVASGEVRQLTFGLGFADYEGCYLPNGDILFTSTRPVQTVDCFWTEVSNLYTCDANGKYLRRLCYDQVHDNFPTVTGDGTVLYTRWDYSDRGQIYPQGLFQMNPDGTGQAEFYGNNSWFPTTILHARAIPGTRKVVAIFTGHHTHQRGKLGILDPALGRQENQGARLIAPVRPTPADRIDAYGQDGPQFQYPYPLGAQAFLVAMDPIGSPNQRYDRPYGIYWIDIEGRRELLAADPKISCNQPIPLAARTRPPVQPSRVDYARKTGVYYLHDIYRGAGLRGIPRGTIRKLRVVAIEFRAAGIRCNYSEGEGGAALSSTPVSVGNGCWDPKIILGDAAVQDDGSACFTVPARTPVYFQALDAKGHAVQTMRSWSVLQPGESYSCVGCHESKNEAPGVAGPTMAMAAGPQELEPFYGPPRGFSFAKEVQPILDRHCVRCHNDRSQRLVADRPQRQRAAGRPRAREVAGSPREAADRTRVFSLLGDPNEDREAGRSWSDAYLNLTQGGYHSRRWRSIQGKPSRMVTWVSIQSAPPMLPPYHAGAARSELIPLLEKGHEGVMLAREELDKIAAWIDLLVPYCGDYLEANAWTDDELEKYRHFLEKRRRMEALEDENMSALVRLRGSVVPRADPREPGKAAKGVDGFVRVSPRDPRYLELSDGRPYIPIGLNMIAPPGGDGLEGMDAWMGKLAANGGNYIRVWLGSPFFDVEHARSGQYDEEKAKRIDGLLVLSRRHGIRVKMCIESFRHFGTRRQAWSSKPLHLVSRGGPARDIADFFDGTRSREQFKGKLAWYRKRYGDEPAIFGWELWNEVNAVAGGDYMAWTEVMLGELHRLFPRNLCMQSLGSFDTAGKRPLHERLSTMVGNDVAQVHRYLDLGASLEVCKGPVDVLAADAVGELLRFKPGRPVLLAETGAVEPSHTGPFKMYGKDRTGMIIHDCLFAPFFAGAAGPGHAWHWDRYVDANDLWWHFGRFAAAVEGIDPPAEGFVPGMLDHPRLRIYMLRGRRRVLLWCRDKQNDWRSELRDGRAPEVIKDAAIRLEGMPLPRGATIRAYDPWSDRWTDLVPDSGAVNLPDFSRSIVVRIDPKG